MYKTILEQKEVIFDKFSCPVDTAKDIENIVVFDPTEEAIVNVYNIRPSDFPKNGERIRRVILETRKPLKKRMKENLTLDEAYLLYTPKQNGMDPWYSIYLPITDAGIHNEHLTVKRFDDSAYRVDKVVNLSCFGEDKPELRDTVKYYSLSDDKRALASTVQELKDAVYSLGRPDDDGTFDGLLDKVKTLTVEIREKAEKLRNTSDEELIENALKGDDDV